MPNNESCTREVFIEQYQRLGTNGLAKALGVSERSVRKRRDRIEKQLGTKLIRVSTVAPITAKELPHRIQVSIKNGIVLVGSDAHIWPGERSLMMRAFIKFAKELKPEFTVLNGDVMDFPRISVHAPIGWEDRPTPQDEIEAAQDILYDLEKAIGRKRKIWSCGNHDLRFESHIARVAPEYARVAGIHLKDHFPNWETCWSVWVNDDVVIKHRFKGGDHAPFNNTIKSGRTFITGHLHSAKVIPYTDYNGTRYGVDSGCLASTEHRAFVDYTEDNPKNWRESFCILTFKDGNLLMPELVMKYEKAKNAVMFRGEVITV